MIADFHSVSSFPILIIIHEIIPLKSANLRWNIRETWPTEFKLNINCSAISLVIWKKLHLLILMSIKPLFSNAMPLIQKRSICLSHTFFMSMFPIYPTRRSILGALFFLLQFFDHTLYKDLSGYIFWNVENIRWKDGKTNKYVLNLF